MNMNHIVALHGVGSSGRDMRAALGGLSTRGDIIAIDGPEPFHANPAGRQWFSIAGVTESNRGHRVQAALPAMLELLDQTARTRGIDRHDLVLLGFSQGAIMTLAAIAEGEFHGRAIAVAGRLAVDAVPANLAAKLLLIHDQDDTIMPTSLSFEACDVLSKAGHQAECEWTKGVGHGFGPATLKIIDQWLAANTSVR